MAFAAARFGLCAPAPVPAPALALAASTALTVSPRVQRGWRVDPVRARVRVLKQRSQMRPRFKRPERKNEK